MICCARFCYPYTKMTTTAGIVITAGDGLTIDSTRALFRKTFPSTYTSKGDKIALLSASIAYSWFNVTSAFNNLTGCSYIYNGVTCVSRGLLQRE